MRPLPPGAPERGKLDKIQSDLVRVDTELAALAVAPLPTAEIRERVRWTLEQDAASAQIVRRLAAQALPSDGAAAPLPEVSWGLLAALFGPAELAERIVTAIVPELSANNHGEAIPTADRRAQVARLETRRRELERAEELEAMRLEDTHDGVVVVRRHDADEDLLLEIWTAADASARSGKAGKQAAA